MKNILLTGLLLGINFGLFGQKPDPEIFNSDFEKSVFKTFVDSLPVKEMDVLLAFQYSSSAKSYEEQITSFCDELKSKGILKNKRKKLINEIFDQVHARFLKKYDEKAFFSDIFSNGNYNCVTASALYSLVLDYFSIDYLIKETPNHVFLIADPSGTSYLIETTLPTKGVTQFDDRFKKAYLDYLLENKIIGEWEYKSNSIDNLFEKHYSASQTINKLQLAALQYYNKGIFSYDERNYKEAVGNFEKAYIIHPSANLKFMLNNALVNLLVEQSNKKKFDGKTLAKYTNVCQSSDQGIQISKQHFVEVSNEMVINHPDISGYEKYYRDFMSVLNDSVEKKDYMQTYNEEMAYYYYLKNNFGKVFFYAGNSYLINPDNIKNRQFVMEAFKQYIQEVEVGENMSLDSMIVYSQKFPFMLSDAFFLQLMSYSFMHNVIESEPGNKQSIVTSLYNLQQYSRKALLLADGNSIVEKLYSEASSFMVRSLKYDMAEAVLKNGLELIPNSTELKTRLRTVSENKASMKNYQKSYTVNYPYPSASFIIPPAYKAEEVHASVKKYLGKCWNVDFYKKDGKTRETKVEQLKFIFYADNKMKFKTGTEEHWGTWKLDESGPTLTLKSNEDQQKFSILIYEVSATVMRGIMSPNTSENKKIEFNTCDK